jgi:hypothetical protein
MASDSYLKGALEEARSCGNLVIFYIVKDILKSREPLTPTSEPKDHEDI